MKTNMKKVCGKKLFVPMGRFQDGDWFKCQKCGYTVRMKVLGNHATCSQCGGQMVRI